MILCAFFVSCQSHHTQSPTLMLSTLGLKSMSDTCTVYICNHKTGSITWSLATRVDLCLRFPKDFSNDPKSNYRHLSRPHLCHLRENTDSKLVKFRIYSIITHNAFRLKDEFLYRFPHQDGLHWTHHGSRLDDDGRRTHRVGTVGHPEMVDACRVELDGVHGGQCFDAHRIVLQKLTLICKRMIRNFRERQY